MHKIIVKRADKILLIGSSSQEGGRRKQPPKLRCRHKKCHASRGEVIARSPGKSCHLDSVKAARQGIYETQDAYPLPLTRRTYERYAKICASCAMRKISSTSSRGCHPPGVPSVFAGTESASRRWERDHRALEGVSEQSPQGECARQVSCLWASARMLEWAELGEVVLRW